MSSRDKIERILWSIAFPGFGQILNGEIIKGVIFIALELLINIESNLNEAIVSSFQGNTEIAVKQVNYQWLMFYPCIYLFAMWDAYRNSGQQSESYSFLPFVFAAYLGTIGVIFSSTFRINRTLLGPVWLPILCLFLGALIGLLIRYFIIGWRNKAEKNKI